MKMIPPGMDEMSFKAALRKFSDIVGKEWVFIDDESLVTYRDDYSPYWDQPEDRKTSAAVAPGSVEEVQAVVAIANEFKVPIFPFSTGKNLGYGGAAANLSGSVIVDLKRMNRIIEVDPIKGHALVEPGVSYFDLYNYIEENNLPVWIDCTETGWGSVMGNALDRGMGYTGQAYRDHFGAVCGLEVVLPNGDLMRTGMGAMPGNKSWQAYKYGFGPYVDGLFSQGNFGIVTKLGIHLMPRPESLYAGTVSVPNYRDIIPLLETLTNLEQQGIVDGIPQIYSPVTKGFEGNLDRRITEVIGRKGGALDSELKSIAKGKPFWTLRVLCYGPEPVAKSKWEYARSRLLSTAKGSKLVDQTYYTIPLSPEQIEGLEPLRANLDRKVNFGIPNLGIFAMGARSPIFPSPSDGHVWFSPTFPRSGEELVKAQNIFCRELIDLDVSIGLNAPLPGIYTSRSFFFLIPIFTSKTDPKVGEKGLQILKHFIDVSAENGWAEYRASPVLQEYIQNLNSFGDHAYLRFVEKIKDAVDPNGIISAGRYGIWPKHLRHMSQRGK
jgi:4-cresol dehydrogenase (hydroxylating)